MTAAASMTPIGDELARMGAKRTSTCRCGAEFWQWFTFGQYGPNVCPTCSAAEEEKRRAEESEALEKGRRAAALMALEVPLLYKNATVDSFRVDAASPEDAKVKARVVQCARRYLGMWDTRQSDDLEFPQIVVFTGEPGTGKGHIAWSIARAVAVDHGDTVKFTVLSDCIRDLRAAWSQNRGEGPSEVARLAEYRRPQLLIIDEVSEHAFHGEASQHLYDLVAWREQRLLPTILTTNAPKAELGRVLGPALVSRAAGWSGVWEFGAEDYRITLKKARRAQGTI